MGRSSRFRKSAGRVEEKRDNVQGRRRQERAAPFRGHSRREDHRPVASQRMNKSMHVDVANNGEATPACGVPRVGSMMPSFRPISFESAAEAVVAHDAIMLFTV